MMKPAAREISVFCLTGKAGTGLRILSYWKGWDRSQDSVLVERLGQVSGFCLNGKAGTGLSILS